MTAIQGPVEAARYRHRLGHAPTISRPRAARRLDVTRDSCTLPPPLSRACLQRRPASARLAAREAHVPSPVFQSWLDSSTPGRPTHPSRLSHMCGSDTEPRSTASIYVSRGPAPLGRLLLHRNESAYLGEAGDRHRRRARNRSRAAVSGAQIPSADAADISPGQQYQVKPRDQSRLPQFRASRSVPIRAGWSAPGFEDT